MRIRFQALLSVWMLLSSAGPVLAKTQANISMARAKATALGRMPGKIKSAELEREKGRLVYSFDILTSDKKIMEVLIDAQTGEVIEVVEETPEHEKQEEAEDKANARKRAGKK